MSHFYVILVDDGIVKSGIYSHMPQQALDLLDGHTFVDGHSGKCAAELVGMNLGYIKTLAHFSNTSLHSTNRQPLVWRGEGNEQCGIVIYSLSKILLKMKLCSGIKVHHTFLVAFTKDDALPLVKVYVGPVQFHKLTHTDARRSQDVNDGEVTPIRAVVTQKLQLLVSKHFLYTRVRLHIVNATHGGFGAVVFILK